MKIQITEEEIKVVKFGWPDSLTTFFHFWQKYTNLYYFWRTTCKRPESNVIEQEADSLDKNRQVLEISVVHSSESHLHSESEFT